MQVPRSETDDARLVEGAREDPTGEAFRALYERHAGEVLRFLVALVGDRSLAEDLLQESFFRVYQHLDRYDPKRAFRPWLFQIARNAGLNGLRARRKGGAKVDVHAWDPAISDRILQRTVADEDRQRVDEALAALDDDTRALLLQRYALDMKQKDLAASWGISERTVRNRIDAAIKELTRALLSGSGGGAQ